MADNNSKQFLKCFFRSVSSTDLKFITSRKTPENSNVLNTSFHFHTTRYTIPLIPLPCLELITTFLCFPFRLFTIHLSAIEADLLYFYHKHTINVPSSSCILSYFCQIWNKSGIEFHEIFPVGAELFDPRGRTGKQINRSRSRFS